MRQILRTILSWVLLVGVIAPVFADEAEQVRMLKLIFAQPVDRWRQLLVENQFLLDSEFFQRIEQRIQWDLAKCQEEDAIRFAHVGDLALGVVVCVPGRGVNSSS